MQRIHAIRLLIRRDTTIFDWIFYDLLTTIFNSVIMIGIYMPLFSYILCEQQNKNC